MGKLIKRTAAHHTYLASLGDSFARILPMAWPVRLGQLAVLGSLLLLLPGPFLTLAKADPDVSDKVRCYLSALAFSLPASMLFTVYRGFNTAVSRPKAVMTIQITGLLLKIPLSALFIYGWTLPLPGDMEPWRVAPMGVVGCGIATAIVMWSQTLIAWHGVEIGVGIAAVLGAAVYFAREPVLHIYTDNSSIIAAAMPLLVWVWWFHVADAAQTMANFVLRSHRVTLCALLAWVHRQEALVRH